MKSIPTLAAFAVLAVATLSAAPAAQAGDAGIERTVREMMEGFNKGDVAAVKALHVAAPTIVDNVAPFRWTGPKAFDTWLSDLAKSEKAQGKTDGSVSLGAPVDEQIAAGRAYVVVPSAYTYQQGGKKIREAGFMALTMVKTKAGWRIASWTWASPSGEAVK